MSTDPLPVTKESFVNPQRWNLYIYVRNNPLVTVDPNGANGEGKGGDKVISVFLMARVEERNANNPSGANWTETGATASKNGYKLEMYGQAQVTGMKTLPVMALYSSWLKSQKDCHVR